MKIVLKRELVDGDANCGGLAAVCLELAEWHRRIMPIVRSDYALGWLKELNNQLSPLAQAINDCYNDCYEGWIPNVAKENGLSLPAVHKLFLTLELDYKLKPVPGMEEMLGFYRSATDERELLSVFTTELISRRWENNWVEGQGIEVTGCRFTLVNEKGERISDEQQDATREYLASLGYPKNATTQEEVARFVRRLHEDVPEIDDVVKII